MIAVILAAGQGTRLRPLTSTTPKCLIDIAGRPILGRMLEAAAAAGICRAIVVTGHLADQVDAYLSAQPQPLPVSVARNASYATTNNAASLAAARSATGGDPFVLCDGDVVFSANPLPSLVALAQPCALAIDRGVRLGAEEMKVQVNGSGTITRLSKQIDAAAALGESIGVQKLDGAALPMLWDAIDAIVQSDAANAYYEDAFQRLIDRGVSFVTMDVAPDSWIEIDDADDLRAARQRFAG